MALWRLTPDPDRLDHPFWARSLNKQPVTVIASDEKDARKKAMAMENNDNAVLEVPGADTPLSLGEIPCWFMQGLSGSTFGHTRRVGVTEGY